jgi:hypothetical protein
MKACGVPHLDVISPQYCNSFLRFMPGIERRRAVETSGSNLVPKFSILRYYVFFFQSVHINSMIVP